MKENRKLENAKSVMKFAPPDPPSSNLFCSIKYEKKKKFPFFDVEAREKKQEDFPIFPPPSCLQIFQVCQRAASLHKTPFLCFHNLSSSFPTTTTKNHEITCVLGVGTICDL